jgi:hypothetical protein
LLAQIPRPIPWTAALEAYREEHERHPTPSDACARPESEATRWNATEVCFCRRRAAGLPSRRWPCATLMSRLPGVTGRAGAHPVTSLASGDRD